MILSKPFFDWFQFTSLVVCLFYSSGFPFSNGRLFSCCCTLNHSLVNLKQIFPRVIYVFDWFASHKSPIWVIVSRTARFLITSEMGNISQLISILSALYLCLNEGRDGSSIDWLGWTMPRWITSRGKFYTSSHFLNNPAKWNKITSHLFSCNIKKIKNILIYMFTYFRIRFGYFLVNRTGPTNGVD